MTPTFRNDLADWFRDHARELPWRDRPTPYRVWVSEIMLQQTRVETVREYFNRFITRFPTIRKLAGAHLDDVLAAWAGLGYYRRARMLHKAARRIVERHSGRFPSRREDVLALPGVGEYTAGAVLSIAFDRPEPIVDGNVERVFARLARVAGNVKNGEGRRAIRGFANTHVKEGAAEGHSPSALNQALMELGALVCTPKSPACPRCPVRVHCGGAQRGDAESFPVLPPRAKTRRRTYLFAVIRDAQGRVLLMRRPEGDRSSLLPSGLWELPHVEWRGARPPVAALRETAGVDFRTTGERVKQSHAIMDYRLTLVAQPAVAGKGGRNGANRRWCDADELATLGVSSAIRKVIDALR